MKRVPSSSASTLFLATAGFVALAAAVLPAACSEPSEGGDGGTTSGSTAGTTGTTTSGATAGTTTAGTTSGTTTSGTTTAGTTTSGTTGATGTAGQLDVSFGDGGVAALEPQAFIFSGATGLVMADDRVVVAGQGRDETGHTDVVIARFTANGQPDAPMGSNASVKYTRTGPYDVTLVGATEVTPGQVAFYGQATAVSAKYGFLEIHDPGDGGCGGFGNNLCWKIPNPTAFERPLGLGAVARDPSGTFYVGGGGHAAVLTSDFVLMKLTSAGTEDMAFGDLNGMAVTNVGDGGDDAITALSLLDGGKVLAVGGSVGGPNPGVVMARYSETGALDPDFGEGGVATLKVPTERLARLGDGSFLGAFKGAGPKTVFIHLLASGAVDPSFGIAGRVEAPWPPSNPSSIRALVPADGRILVGYEDFTVGRFTASGAVDSAWGGTGFVTVPASRLNGGAPLDALGVQSGGRVVAMGSQGKGGNQTKFMFAVRLLKE